MKRTVIEVIPYDKIWPETFNREKKKLKPLLEKISASSVEHFGSTAVPGLHAKPIIDILIGVKEIAIVDGLIAEFELYNYDYLKSYERGRPYRRYFRKVIGNRHLVHLHIVEQTTLFHRIHLLTRDYLRTHPKDMKAYGKVKLALAKKYFNDRHAYTIAKSDFIHLLMRKSIVWDAMLR